MEILNHKDQKDLVGYLPYVRQSIKDWLFVDIRLSNEADIPLTVTQTAEAVHALFKNREGKLYICNEREILMIVRWGRENPASIVADSVGKALPAEGCEIFVHEPTVEGIAKLEILISYKKPVHTTTLADIRATRRENVILVADDDMYMRLLIKKGVGPNFTVCEVANGAEVFEACRKFAPDIVFLDIHMPGMEGTDALGKILSIDPKAFVVMVSADSSRENVEDTIRKGAKGFMTKPFSKEKLQEYLSKCPTIS